MKQAYLLTGLVSITLLSTAPVRPETQKLTNEQAKELIATIKQIELLFEKFDTHITEFFSKNNSQSVTQHVQTLQPLVDKLNILVDKAQQQAHISELHSKIADLLTQGYATTSHLYTVLEQNKTSGRLKLPYRLKKELDPLNTKGQQMLQQLSSLETFIEQHHKELQPHFEKLKYSITQMITNNPTQKHNQVVLMALLAWRASC